MTIMSIFNLYFSYYYHFLLPFLQADTMEIKAVLQQLQQVPLGIEARQATRTLT